MPFVQVSAAVRLHYEIRYCDDGEPSEASQRPWLMIVHPLLMDSAYIRGFAEQPRLCRAFNQIRFDARHHGRSENAPSKALDLYSLAADLAIGLEKLAIPAVHAFATHSWASEILLRMAALFPFKVLSLCLSSPPPPVLEGFLERAFQECFESTANPDSVEAWDEGVVAIQWFNFGEPSLIECDILDEWAGVLVRRYPPSRSVNCALCVWPFLDACKVSKPDYIPKSLCSRIKVPVLILWGTNDTIFTEAGCRQRLDELPFHEHSTVKTVQDAPLLFCRTHPQETERIYMEWMQEILDGKYSTKSTEGPTEATSNAARWQTSLEKIAEWREDRSILERDPLQSDSYNRNSEEEIAFFGEVLAQLRVQQDQTFSLFGGGAPELWTGASLEDSVPWRFSSRFDEARMFGPAEPILQRAKIDCEVEAVEVKTSVEICYQMQDLIEL